MQIVSTNIGLIREVDWQGQKIVTGIFKKPIDEPLFLGKRGVNKDEVADLKAHGGSDKGKHVHKARLSLNQKIVNYSIPDHL